VDRRGDDQFVGKIAGKTKSGLEVARKITTDFHSA